MKAAYRLRLTQWPRFVVSASLLCACGLNAQKRPTANLPAADTALAAGAEAMRGGHPAQAVAAFQTVTQLRPQFAEGFLNLGLAYQQQHNFPEAAKALDKARTLKPTLRGANLFLGIADYQTGAYDPAEEALLREVKLSPKDPTAKMWLGIAEEAQGKVEQAAAALDAAAALSQKDIDIRYHQGRVHLLLSKASYQEMFAVDPDSYRVHQVLGQADEEADKAADAIGEYKLAIDRAPTHEGLHEELGDLYWKLGQTSAADEAYRQELAIDPYSFTAHYKLGSLRVIVGKPDQGVALLEKAIQLDPKYVNTYYYLGRAQAELGQDEAGIASLRRATQAPDDPTLVTLSYYQLSRVYRRLHRMDEANAALATFRTMRTEVEKQQTEKRAKVMARYRGLPGEEQLPTENDPPSR